MSQHPAHEEIELKFSLTDAARAASLCVAPTLANQFRLTPATVVTHLDHYLDTPDYALLRRGVTLRLRQTADGALATLKSLSLNRDGPWHKRLEIEGQLPVAANPNEWTEWPDSLRKSLSVYLLDGARLRPICALNQTRHKRLVLPMEPGAGDRDVTDASVELSIDEVQVLDIERVSLDEDDQRPNSSPLSTFWELEAELITASGEAQLVALGERLAHSRGLRPLARSKFERALQLTLAHLRIDGVLVNQWTPTLTMADACRLVWRQQLAQLLLNEAGARLSDNDEYIHKMRVSLRRIRTARLLFGDYFRKKRIAQFDLPLRTTGRLLGAVRDRDVALKGLKQNQSAESGDPKDYTTIENQLRARRDEKCETLVAWLDSDDYRRFLRRFTRFCASPGKGVRHFPLKEGEAPTPYHVRYTLPTLLNDRYARVRVFEQFFMHRDEISPETLHRLRIQCKILRYVFEFAQPLLGRDALRLTDALKTMQERLGALNDAAMSQSMLADLAGEDEAVIETHRAAQQTQIEALRNEVKTRFDEFISLRTRRSVARALTRI
jgi:triphosphatase